MVVKRQSIFHKRTGRWQPTRIVALLFLPLFLPLPPLFTALAAFLLFFSFTRTFLLVVLRLCRSMASGRATTAAALGGVEWKGPSGSMAAGVFFLHVPGGNTCNRKPEQQG